MARGLDLIDCALAEAPPKVAIQLAEHCRRRIDATESRVLADWFERGATIRAVEDMVRSQNNTSKNEAKKRARRAKATNANPDIANRMAEGTLSAEQADVISQAAEDTDGQAACDEGFIEEVASVNPEQGKKKATAYVNERKSKAKIEKRHEAQRRRRTTYRYRTKDGDYVFAVQGDEHTIDNIENNVDVGADLEYQADGGRDVPNHKHPRTRDQRRFDAAARLLGADPTPATGQKQSSQAASNDVPANPR